MKILLLDESKTEENFIFGGFIIDTEDYLSLKSAIRKINKNNLLYEFFEPKWNTDECNKQLNKIYKRLAEDENTELLNYALDPEENKTNTFRLITSENNKKIKDEINKKVILGGSISIKFIVHIFRSLNKLNPGEKIDKYKKGIDICGKKFEEYLEGIGDEGIVLIDEIGDSKDLSIEVLSNYLKTLKLKNIKIFIPNINSDECFGINNIFLGELGYYLGNNKKQNGIIYNLKKIFKDKVYFYGVSPKIDEVFYKDTQVKINNLI